MTKSKGLFDMHGYQLKHLFLLQVLLVSSWVMHAERSFSESVREKLYQNVGDAAEVGGQSCVDEPVIKRSIRSDFYIPIFSDLFSIDASDQAEGFSGSIVGYSTVYDGAFNNCKKRVSLAAGSLGGTPTVGDMYLFARLSAENKVRIDDAPARTPVRPANPPPPVPPFGGYEDEQYPSHFADNSIDFCQVKEEAGVLLSFVYEPCFSICGNTPLFGAYIPVKSFRQDLSLPNSGATGGFAVQVFASDGAVRESSVFQLYYDFVSYEDFITRGVLGSKGISFKSSRKVGFGDLSLFALCGLDLQCDEMVTSNVGVNFIIGTGGRPKTDQFLAPVLGSGLRNQIEFFAELAYAGDGCFINPIVQVAYNVPLPFSATTRVAQQKGFTGSLSNSVRALVLDVPGLIAPPNFTTGDGAPGYWVDAFTEVDSTFPQLADGVACVRWNPGNTFLLNAGTYFDGLFDDCLDLGIFYQFIIKRHDSAKIKTSNSCKATNSTVPVYNTGALSCNTDALQHQVSWDARYAFNCGEISFGSRHVFAGKNVYRIHEAFLGVQFMF